MNMELTPEQVKAIIAKVTETGQRRQQTFGKKFNQGDFIAGFGAALAALGNTKDVPTEWIFGTMAGVKVFDQTKKESSEL